MHKDLGIFGSLTFQSIRYFDDKIHDLENGYKLGFAFNVLPVLRLRNSYMSVSVVIAWLCWQIVWYRHKDVYIERDIQGKVTTYHHGVRYFLSLRWLFSKV